MAENRFEGNAGKRKTTKLRIASNETLGLTTAEALEKLTNDIRNVLEQHEKKSWKNKSYKGWLKDALHHKSQYTTLCWTSAMALIINSLSLIIGTIYKSDNGSSSSSSSLPYEGLIVLLFVIFNFILVVADNKLRHNEIPHRVRILIKKLESAQNICKWEAENYPHLCTPLSPCLTLQWTYRDGKIINLPWALLVMGDIIVIKPGQQVPGYCKPFDCQNDPKLYAKDIYNPPAHSTNEIFSTPQARLPRQNKLYMLYETPYLTNLRMALEQALVRPVTYYNRERHLVMICCIEQLLYPIILIIIFISNLLRYLYLFDNFGIGHWVDIFINQPIATTLPLLPIVFSQYWIVLNCFGMARFKALFELYQSSKKMPFIDPFDDTDISGPNNPDVVYNWSELKEYFFDILLGREFMMSRSASILHVLGSVTALCCVDKKGILSWANPTAEKVFFLRNASTLSRSSSTVSLEKQQEPQMKTNDANKSNDKTDKNDTTKIPYSQSDISHSVAEVLDLTHDHALPFRLQFDDQSWRQHLNSLKPLGLAILLNTCNMETQEHYTKFCCHVTCEALYNENLVPVTNRRCLCELAKQIGFQDQAQEIFQLEQQLATFRHVQPEMVRRDIKFARSLSIATKLKFPFPHMMAVVVKERAGAGLQLLTQGTADVILDSCIEFWDGHDLCPLTPADRKKVQDFYQRSSLTAYCTAFAYRPLIRGVNNKLSNVYLELPSDCKHLYAPHRSPTPIPWDFRNILDPRARSLFGQFHSTDSLLCNENKDDEVNDVDSCFELQCNQIFIGMVTMQYQAQADMVQLIEQLERACIRFVHFSKENELRSRVFSEKMGLESGWNCHISLLSEKPRSESPIGGWVSQAAAMSSPTPSVQSYQNNYNCMDEASQLLYPRINNPRTNLDSSKAMSMSAPSAINTDYSIVKFDDEATEWHNADPSQAKSTTSQSLNQNGNIEGLESVENDTIKSDDSVLVQSVDLGCGQEIWRSLSCLTDSTEQSAPVNFDLSNRAKLPRGIDKIRPHIELIDNVPLLVSLFTDCNTAVTREMLHIMQDYGEVVCVLGSSANAENMAIFMQADASVAVEPLYPQVCQKVPVIIDTKDEQGPSPIDLSRSLNSIACSLSVKREDSIALFHFVMEARDYMKCLTNCVQFWLCCNVTLSFTQLLSCFLLLPPIFTVGQILWLTCLIIPLLSVSMIATPTDPTIMQRATGKNQCVVNGKTTMFVLWCYGSKFLPTILITVTFQMFMYMMICPNFTNNDHKCFYVYPNTTSNFTWGGWGKYPNIILIIQHLALTIIVLHFVTISSGFVHREYSIWRRLPFTNWPWFFCGFLVLALQAFFSFIYLYDIIKIEQKKFINLPIHLSVFLMLSLPLVFVINEFVKWQEIKANVRYQKRARLEFGTKLGMNSPF
ncbi:transmembrane protein 94 isoform X3 [Aphidius gifuensis]|uniref:transmembrane protein 94 isoform X3 n=1 Tax=Aphidius gifuensis TaxID=684658 RepID=UPI001CDB5461|nr:transmembrane protein 94 isoform X3 [Aphidius gifuensis]